MKKVFLLFEILFFRKKMVCLGSSVIRFIHAYIGDEAFRTGLANYLAEYAYKNTTTENLWSHLSEASKRPHLIDILSTWTKQMGFPLLTVCLEIFRISFD